MNESIYQLKHDLKILTYFNQ